MKIKRTGALVHVTCESAEDLARMFCRFQEHYESPEFKGKAFTLGQFREWYSASKGAWTYYQDWTGFNFPSSILDPFERGLFDPLTRAEYRLLDVLKSIPKPFYVIGTSPESESDVLAHEMLHALYFINPKYRDAINALFDVTYPPLLSPLRNHLRELGYHEDVIVDEMQAYLGASEEYLKENKVEYSRQVAERVREIAAFFQRKPDGR